MNNEGVRLVTGGTGDAPIGVDDDVVVITNCTTKLGFIESDIVFSVHIESATQSVSLSTQFCVDSLRVT